MSVNSQSEGGSHKSQSSMDTNPFADDMSEEDDEVLTSPNRLEADTSISSVILRKSHERINSDDSAKPDDKTKADEKPLAAKVRERTNSGQSQKSLRTGSFPVTPEKLLYKKKGLAPRIPSKTDTE